MIRSVGIIKAIIRRNRNIVIFCIIFLLLSITLYYAALKDNNVEIPNAKHNLTIPSAYLMNYNDDGENKILNFSTNKFWVSYCQDSSLPSNVNRIISSDYYKCSEESDYVVDAMVRFISENNVELYTFPYQKLENLDYGWKNPYVKYDEITKENIDGAMFIEPICEKCSFKYIYYIDDSTDVLIDCPRNPEDFPNPLCTGDIYLSQFGAAVFIRFPATKMNQWNLIVHRISGLLNSWVDQ